MNRSLRKAEIIARCDQQRDELGRCTKEVCQSFRWVEYLWSGIQFVTKNQILFTGLSALLAGWQWKSLPSWPEKIMGAYRWISNTISAWRRPAKA